MSVEWIIHKGKRILYIKYGGLNIEEQIRQIKSATQILVDTRVSDNLTLTDIVDASISQAFVECAKEQGKISGPLTRKAAVVGVEGVRKILLKAVNTVSGNPRVPFSTLEEAKEWLIQ